MHYQITRNGQMYGPYTIEDLQRYIASGHVLPTDLTKSEDMSDWISVSELLAREVPGAIPPAGYGAAPAPFQQPGISSSAVSYPDPPNLHWALVLLLGLLTCGIFTIIYDLVQAAWLKRVQPDTKALFYYIAAAVCWLFSLGNSMSRIITMHGGYMVHRTNPAGGLLSLAYLVFLLVARFAMRSSLEEHYNGPEPIGLRLSGIMTFFFGSLYFQYHFNRINEIKRGLRYH